ncbi:hypothetical protein [Actinomadura gamaensis]|uniref:DUF11 domain-containing protein n=1 Tax=Actinomadura gamaensis TaxID=1763541 RepID=A0ABV9U532_9ACTN
MLTTSGIPASASGGQGPASAGGPGPGSVDAGGRADLGVTLAASPRPARVGDLLGYTMTVRNAGPGAGTRAAVLTLPDAVDVVGVVERGCAESGRTIRCTFPATAPGGARSVHILGIVRPRASGVLRATARLDGPSDPVARNDVAELDTPVAPSTDLAIRLDAPRTAQAGSPLPIKLTVTNRGSREARRVVVNVGAHGATLARVRGAKCGGVRRHRTGEYVRCPLGRLASGHSRTFTVFVRVATNARSHSLAASAELELGDYDPSNNVAVAKFHSAEYRHS